MIRSQAHPEAVALYRAILAHPDEDTPRLVYADWLDEHDDLDRAEFIRVQCRLARMNEWDDGYTADCLRAERLRHEHWAEWTRPPIGGTQPPHSYYKPVRGFPGAVSLGWAMTESEARRWYGVQPI